MAELAELPVLPGQRTGEEVPSAAIPPLPRAVPGAAGGPLGRAVAGHRSPSGPGSCDSGDAVAGSAAAAAGAAARGPARRPQSARFSLDSLPAARLLCSVPDAAECAPAVFLLPLMPPGFAASSRPRSTLACAAPATPSSYAAFAATTSATTSFQIAGRFLLIYSVSAPSGEGSGWVRFTPGPPLLSSIF